MASTCGAFVGENTAAASEYHSNDFDWEDLRAEVEALTNEQQQSKENHSCNGRHFTSIQLSVHPLFQ